jgi:hypothetical protein
MKVLPIKNEEAYPWLLEKHYAKRIPQIMFAFGLYEDGQIVGVVTYGMPASPSLCMGICGKEYSDKVLELNRLCLMDNYKNQSSFLIANSMKLLPKPSIIVSYADTEHGHVGYVYQATNFLYTGLSAIRVDWQIKGLEDKHTRHMGKTLEQIKLDHGDNFYYKERSRKHRYIYFHGTKTDKKILLSKLNYEIKPYPKGDSKRYDSGGNVKTQQLLFI